MHDHLLSYQQFVKCSYNDHPLVVRDKKLLYTTFAVYFSGRTISALNRRSGRCVTFKPFFAA